MQVQESTNSTATITLQQNKYILETYPSPFAYTKVHRFYRPMDRLTPSLAGVLLLSFLTTKARASATSPTDGWSHGTVLLNFWATLPEIPDIVAEWAALAPLTVYLSSMRTSYELASEVSLRAKLSASIVPKL